MKYYYMIMFCSLSIANSMTACDSNVSSRDADFQAILAFVAEDRHAKITQTIELTKLTAEAFQGVQQHPALQSILLLEEQRSVMSPSVFKQLISLQDILLQQSPEFESLTKKVRELASNVIQLNLDDELQSVKDAQVLLRALKELPIPRVKTVLMDLLPSL